MNNQWQELKETIVELRDGDGTGTQQEVCKFLANYMDILEKQMQEPCKNTIDRQAVLDIVDSYSESQSNVEDVTQDIISDIIALPPVNPTKTGHWIRELIRNEKGGCIGAKMICSECGKDNKHDEYMTYCPNCGAKMQESEDKE